MGLICGGNCLRMDDGAEITALPSGHDAWVAGNEPVVTIDWSGEGHYARHRTGSATSATRPSPPPGNRSSTMRRAGSPSRIRSPRATTSYSAGATTGTTATYAASTSSPSKTAR